MKDRQLVFADGIALDDCSVSYDGAGTLWIYCPLSLRQGAEVFLDEARTVRLVYGLGEARQIYDGFTDPRILNVVPGGLRVMLTGEHTEMHTEAGE